MAAKRAAGRAARASLSAPRGSAAGAGRRRGRCRRGGGGGRREAACGRPSSDLLAGVRGLETAVFPTPEGDAVGGVAGRVMADVGGGGGPAKGGQGAGGGGG